MTTERFWEIIAAERKGILATIGGDGRPTAFEHLLPGGPFDPAGPILDNDQSDQGPKSFA